MTRKAVQDEKIGTLGEASLRRNMQVPQCESVPRGDEGIAPYVIDRTATKTVGDDAASKVSKGSGNPSHTVGSYGARTGYGSVDIF